MARFGLFSVKLLAATAVLSLVGSGVATADTGVVSGSLTTTSSAYVAPSAQFTQETPTGSLDPYVPPERSQGFQIIPRAVWGADDRIRVTDTTAYPYSAVVSIGNASNTYWCTGFMIGEDVLLTAAHCVLDKNTGKNRTGMVFRPAANGTNEPFGQATAKKIVVGPEFKKAYANYDPHDDWAVVKLSSTVGKKTGYFGVKADMPSGTKLTLTGYPADKFSTYGLSMWSATGEVKTSGEYYYSQIDMYGMQSGSPLYDTSKYVGAINIADDSSYNWHERITPDIATVVQAMKDNTSVLVSSVKVTGSTSLKVGGQTVLTSNITPRVADNKSVSWKSSDTGVATVDANGKVTGKKAGTVTITATAQDGSGKSGSLKITVKSVPVSKVAVSGASQVAIGFSTSLKVSVSPSDATNKAVSWKSSDTSVATVDANGKVTGKKAGVVTITATAKDGSGKSASLKLSVAKRAWSRLWGNNNFDTMAKVAQFGFTQAGGTVVIATSAGYYDALTANSIAGIYNAPILFTEPKSLTAQTKTELARLKPTKVIVAGGSGVVADNVLSDIQKTTGVKPVRYWGSNASATADALAKAGKGKWGTNAIVVTDASYWDGLSIGSYSYAKHAPIFYAQSGKKLSVNTLNTMKDLGITKVYVIGGPSAVSTNVDSQIKAQSMTVQRVYGSNVIATSQKVAEFALGQGMQANRMGIATTGSYYDGLVASPLLGKNNSVIVLTDSKDLSAIDAVYGKNKAVVTQGYIFGGKNVVSDSVYNYVNK